MAAGGEEPETVHFPSAEGKTSLVGYLFSGSKNRCVPYAPLLMLLASADDEVSPRVCERFAAKVRAAGAPLELLVYEGAEHNFDDPGPTTQRRDANRRATEDAMARAERFPRTHLGS